MNPVRYIFHFTVAATFIIVVLLAPRVELIKTDTIQKIQEETVEPPRPLVLVFSGDVMQHIPQIDAARSGDGFDYSPVFGSISRLWKEADFAIVNLETTIAADGEYSGYPCFSSPAQLVYALWDAGVDVAALANNHCMDRGESGVRSTLAHLDSAGIAHTGVRLKSDFSQSVLIIGNKDYRVALLNYTYDTNGLPVPSAVTVNLIDTIAIREDITQARNRDASHIIAFFHWGNEYERRPDKEQRTIAAWCRSNGIDAVIGSHTHTVQRLDPVNQVAYSLGNLVSNQRRRYTDGGISVTVTLHPDSSISMTYTPHWVDSYGPERYRILLPDDTATRSDAAFRRSLDDSRTAAEIL